MKLLYCARCGTPLMSAAAVHICPTCGAVYHQRENSFIFAADLPGAHIKEFINSLEVTA